MTETAAPKYWKLRFTISLLLLVLSLIGMIVVDFAPKTAWTYWSFMIPLFGILSLWLSYLDHDKKIRLAGITLLHELLHWIALGLAVYIVSIFMRFGILSDMIAGLFIMTLLSLATFLAGVYIDSTFVVIGLLLGIFTIVAAFFVKYLLIITIPLCVIIAVILYLLHKRSKVS